MEIVRNQDWWIAAYRTKRALWISDRNPARPHCQLTAGDHSSGFFNSRLVIPDEDLLKLAAIDLVDFYVAGGGSIDLVNRVVGPQTGATKLAEFIAAEITLRRPVPCDHASPAKQGEGEDKLMVFTDPNERALPGEVVLLCEDETTTGSSVGLTADACLEAGATVLPFVLALVNRSGLAEAGDRRILALIDHYMPKWQPSDCPLCQRGSKAIFPPKDHWDALNADYPPQPTAISNDKRLCLALDGLSFGESLAIVGQIGPRCQSVKIHALLDKLGPPAIGLLIDQGAPQVWVDYKLHDTKDTVGFRVAALRSIGAKVITVHASGGVSMMRAAVEAAGEQTEIWAITVLTSLDEEEIGDIYGRERSRQQIVSDFAYMAKKAGVVGLVCSAQEVGMLSTDPQLVGMKLVVPGTRSTGVALGQQKRSGTPAQAMIDGATYLVAGSQVTKSPNPLAAWIAMEDEIKTG